MRLPALARQVVVDQPEIKNLSPARRYPIDSPAKIVIYLNVGQSLRVLADDIEDSVLRTIRVA